ncbi:hypothetical protein QRD90_09155 [Peribacillus frigoritolerans]|uniref:hypothetical protein n=1 Tax=Peribacillus frigoritolerans TaxID=450367 RepID=UPI002079C885|nr:hypothetical protein [Peribacillus frigoritolerans]USK82035.1 hypothetical protein LHV56_09075 [Peribacillus frigoritolerans]UYZ00658.1 hypothetical protein OJ967_09275 [Peribacillus frigoritolerans]WJE49326.1 hypothetical protein QRD90_09155 [Peribacillus frigoritolerans]
MYEFNLALDRLGIWETDKVEVEYHPSIRHIAFQVTLEDLKNSVVWLKSKGYKPREAFSFDPIEPFVMPHEEYAHTLKFILMT